MRTIFISRGFTLNSTAADPGFKGLREMLNRQGYQVIPVPTTWNRQTLTSYVVKLAQFYEQNKSEHNTLLGGSFGAMASFIAAPLIRPDELILCSLSAFFREDLSNYEDQYLLRKFGMKRAEDLKSHCAKVIAEQILQANIKTTLLYGEKEKTMHPKLVARVRDTAAALHTAPIELLNAGHKMREPEYIVGLKHALS